MGSATMGADSSTGGDTGQPGGPPCDLDEVLCSYAEGKVDPIDCGVITLDDDAAAWQAAVDCASAAAFAQTGFKVGFQLQGFDSTIYEGFYGTVGFVYGTGRLYLDTFGDPMLSAYSCNGIELDPGCMPDVGTHCLQCLEQGDGMPLECLME